MSPFFIGISGESGVGKSTIANVISIHLGNEDTLRLSTDDLHKWARASPNWDKLTHLNPAANNLELGDMHIADLAENQPIFRSVYNHAAGIFDPPVKMVAKKYIINEGLHAFYTDGMQSIMDLKIFVDTDEELRTHWKLIRDTESRGYKYNSVMEAIDKRRHDACFVNKQKDSADVVIKLGTAGGIKRLGYKREDIVLTIGFDYRNDSARQNPMFAFVEQFMLALNDFTTMSNALGNIELCQNAGGNASVKASDDLMIIKSSGYEMKDIHGLNGHSVVRCKNVRDGFGNGAIKDDCSLVRCVTEAVPLQEYRRPSMETGFHVHLGKYVAHTHPIYLNVILCSNNSKRIVEHLYANLNYMYVGYENPGFDVCKKIMDVAKRDIYFLENHGLIVSSDNCVSAVQKSIEINAIAKGYLAQYGHLEEFSLDFADMPPERAFFYPDSAVFLNDDVVQKKEVLAAHNYINKIGKSIGGLRYLSQENVSFLQNLEAEAYRKTL